METRVIVADNARARIFTCHSGIKHLTQTIDKDLTAADVETIIDYIKR